MLPKIALYSKFGFYGDWAGISLVYFELAAISRLIHKGNFLFFFSNAQGGHWTHVINLSGDDFITKPIEEITDILQREKGNSFIEILTDLEPKLLEHNRYNVKSCPGRYLKLRKHG